MRVHYIVAVLTWIATVTATLESDSRGNWSNEKKLPELNYEQKRIRNQTKQETTSDDHSPSIINQQERIFESSESAESTRAESPGELTVKFVNKNEDNREVNEQFTKQIVQPYVLPLEGRLIQEDIRNESTRNVSRSIKTSKSTLNETVTVEYVPSQEILAQDSTATFNNYPVQDSNFNDLAYLNTEDHVDLENVGEFGQRVRSSSFRSKGNENLGRGRPRPSDPQSFIEEYRKQHRKGSRPFLIKKPNVSDSIANQFSKDRHPVASAKASESQRVLKQKKIEEDTDYVQSNRIKLPGASWTSNEERRKHDPEENGAFNSKDTAPSTSAPVLQVSLGKFTGPIVVADLPRQKKYSFATTTEYAVGNDEAQSTPSPVETARSKAPESSYLGTSSAVLNPLQVGVALMNVGQDINSVNGPVTFIKDYVQDEPDASRATVPDIEGIIQNDSADSGNSSVQVDQLTQQEQVSEVVASNLPTQSVEIQKSVEIFHTAPVHEIHYPLEFVPYVQQSNLKQRQQQTDHRKLQRGQRPGQVNVYKSNEILDETVSSSNQERGRYEYSVNEDDVYSSTNGQVDQTLGPAHSAEVKTVFDFREQLDDLQYNQTAGKYSRIQRIPDTVTTEGAKQAEYDPAKGVSFFGTQPVGIIDSLPALANIESAQGSQEAPQILLTKPSNEPPAEVRYLIPVPQHYPAEKVPYQVEKVIEKQITIPQPFPVHVPVDRVVEKQIRLPYPVHVEKVIEKKVPLAIQRFIIPVPIHFRIPQPVPIPVEKVVEKSVPVPVPVPVPIEKAIEKTVHLPRSHPLDVEIRPYPLENPKPVKTVPPLIYNVQNEGNFRQQNFQAPLGPSHEKNHFNATQFHGLGYLGRPYVRQPTLHALLPKKFASYGVQYPHSLIYSSSNGNNGNLVTYGRIFPEKDKIIDEYVGPVPRKVQISLGIQSKSLQYAPPDVQSTLRRTRQEGNTGNFRQSKMEYGFKPPMVPSIQYDEQTATKVE